MNQLDFETFIAGLDDVQREDNFGYAFFFVGADHRLPFVTIANSDNEYDQFSNLNRDGVFRLNIGISKATFEALLAGSLTEHIDYTALDVFLPHPEYAKQHFVCILNPTGERIERTKELIVEAHSIAAARLRRTTGNG